MPKAARAVNIAKIIASHLACSPRSSANMGPPSIRPSLVLTLYLTARRPSEYFVAMPKKPVIQHHSTAPGPPSATAVATPTILPVPRVAARAVASAPNCETSPLEPLSFVNDRRNAVPIFNCGKRRRTVKNKCVPSRSIIIGHPHTADDILSIIEEMAICKA